MHIAKIEYRLHVKKAIDHIAKMHIAKIEYRLHVKKAYSQTINHMTKRHTAKI